MRLFKKMDGAQKCDLSALFSCLVGERYVSLKSWLMREANQWKTRENSIVYQ
jgi:hypothetical protein